MPDTDERRRALARRIFEHILDGDLDGFTRTIADLQPEDRHFVGNLMQKFIAFADEYNEATKGGAS